MASITISDEAHPSNGEDHENDHPIEQVRLVVPPTDDPSLPALTFRTWFIGIISCMLLAVVNKFFDYRTNSVGLQSVCVQIVALPLGRLMAATLPTRKFRVPLTSWSFSLNPGPFNLKEHVLITIFAGTGSAGVYSMHIVNIVKALYKRSINPLAGMMLAQTTQVLGYGIAGLFRKYLVDSPYMWWPSNLIQVSLFSALHEIEKRPRGGFTRMQFFLLVLVCSFAYYVVPGFLFPAISYISLACYIWKNSVTAQQIGSGFNGLGIGSFGLDWSSVTNTMGNPLSVPAFALFNTLAGFVLIVYVLFPISYWTNSFDAKKFPFISSQTFDQYGHIYNTSRVIDDKTFTLDILKYEDYSKINLSVFFAYAYGLGFASLAASLVHVLLYNGSSIWKMWKETTSAAKGKYEDIHTRLMKKNYDEVPQWWFHLLIAAVLGLSIYTCEGFGKQLQLPWWGVLLAFALSTLFTLPIGVIIATTNQSPGLNIISEFIIGYIMPGKPLANVTFKTYGTITMSHALNLLSDFKLGHYMKIAPKAMFFVQLVGTIIASTVTYGTGWYLLSSIDNICDTSKLHADSPWTCPDDNVFYSASIIWGLVGPRRMFGDLGLYSKMMWFFLFGLLAPIPFWLLSKAFPNNKFISLIHVPLILTATSSMPPGRTASCIMYMIVGILFNHFVYRRYKAWWARHTYLLSAGLDAGVAFMGVLIFFTLGYFNINSIPWWGGVQGDHCPLANCPTAPGIVKHGCPVF